MKLSLWDIKNLRWRFLVSIISSFFFSFSFFVRVTTESRVSRILVGKFTLSVLQIAQGLKSEGTMDAMSRKEVIMFCWPESLLHVTSHPLRSTKDWFTVPSWELSRDGEKCSKLFIALYNVLTTWQFGALFAEDSKTQRNVFYRYPAGNYDQGNV